MTSIGQTMKEIESFQSEILKVEYDDDFQFRLVNITTIIYFDYLSHSILYQAKNLNLSSIKEAEKYYKLYSQKHLLQEQIRINAVGLFFNLWLEYERFLRRKLTSIKGEDKFKISSTFNELLNLIPLEKRGSVENEFEVIRITRNSLHDGGIYKLDKPYKGKIGHQTYIFVKNHPVIPIRNLDVVKTIWKHFMILNTL